MRSTCRPGRGRPEQPRLRQGGHPARDKGHPVRTTVQQREGEIHGCPVHEFYNGASEQVQDDLAPILLGAPDDIRFVLTKYPKFFRF
ncbi:hypothetical protein NDU88_006714 [Pleurodeles waltl]|uniref:Uncharacterized protein n=1 Tax=Pleurodeles waltl TaxID=8319 RepID=A0AAV7TXU8_PLEWA|nr:hypothetical protein NDU88_006714 [Pleurodeles waltl]